MKYFPPMMSWVIAVMLAMPVSAAAQDGEAAKHLLFYGNSFTIRNDVPASVSQLAEAAGHPAPVIVRNVAGGKRMAWHLEQTQTSPERNIAAEAVAERQYDAVILQGYSTEPTRIGNRDAFVRNTLALARLVRESNAGRNATFVLYQTWARGHGHDMYPDRFPDASAMQQDLIEGYEEARQALAAAFGADATVVAPVGTAFAAMHFDDQLYGSDIYHAGPVGSLLSAMVLYRTLYGGTIADIDEQRLAEAREQSHWSTIPREQWERAAQAADECDIPRADLQPATAAP